MCNRRGKRLLLSLDLSHTLKELFVHSGRYSFTVVDVVPGHEDEWSELGRRGSEPVSRRIYLRL